LHGELSDSSLADWYLSQGGFLILIDGLNEVDRSLRNATNTFVTKHSKRNVFCLTSQELHPVFDWVASTKLAHLGKQEIEEMLRSKLEPGEFDRIHKQLNPGAYKICRLPQNLGVAINLINQGGDLPTTEDELYNGILKPVLHDWERKADYKDVLFERSFEMLASKEPYFEAEHVPSLPDEFYSPLLRQKIFTKRGEKHMFRHDLVRGFLAAKHVTPQWQAILADRDKAVNDNWESMLRFVILELGDSAKVREIVFAVLRRNAQLAKELFQWLESVHPSLCEAWAEEFQLALGKAMTRPEQDRH
jgi:hypothetical protein